MQHLEALVLDLLVSVTLNVTLEEVERGLVSLDGIAKIVLENGLGFSQERSNGLDARRALQVLRVDHLLEVLVQSDTRWQLLELEVLKDSREHCSESLEIPVLVDDLVDHSRLEHLVRFIGKQVDKVVHLVDGLRVIQILAAPLRQKLLTEGEDKVSEVRVGCQLDTLPRCLNAELNFVAHWAK